MGLLFGSKAEEVAVRTRTKSQGRRAENQAAIKKEITAVDAIALPPVGAAVCLIILFYCITLF